MSDIETLDLEQAIRDNYRLWNEGKREELGQAFPDAGTKRVYDRICRLQRSTAKPQWRKCGRNTAENARPNRWR